MTNHPKAYWNWSCKLAKWKEMSGASGGINIIRGNNGELWTDPVEVGDFVVGYYRSLAKDQHGGHSKDYEWWWRTAELQQ